jgi:hypothetical protein
LLPILVFLCFVGFPPPFAPPRATRPAQEQSETVKKEEEEKKWTKIEGSLNGIVVNYLKKMLRAMDNLMHS